MTEIDKVALFERLINSAADAEADKLLTSAERRAEETLKCADEEYIDEAYQDVSAETKKIKKNLERKVSQENFESSKELLTYRQNLSEEFFKEIYDKIVSYSNCERYEKRLAVILSEVYLQRVFSEDTVIFVRPSDVDKVKKLYPKNQIKADKKIKLGGVSVFYSNDKIYIDRTFDSAFEQQKAAFAENDFMRL